MSETTFLVWILVLSYFCSGNAQLNDHPPNYNYHELPETKFTCEGKFTSRYYADPDTDCQMFHICAKTNRREISDYKFLCPNGTVFDQEHQVCADYYQVVCDFSAGSNPLGQVFEIYKISSKESTNQREFGSVPIRDPQYLGQNNLGGDDFQAEEYNNNKLAASRNSLSSFQNSRKHKDSLFFEYTTTTTTTTPRPKRLTTPKPTRPSTTTQPNYFEHLPNVERDEVPSIDATLPPSSLTFSRRLVQTATPRRDFTSLQFIHPQEHITETFIPTTPSTPSPSLFVSTFQPRATIDTSSRASSIFDKNANFNNFASLSKFQKQFHGSFINPPKTTQNPTTTTEAVGTTTLSPFLEFIEPDNLGFSPQQYEFTTPPEIITTERVSQSLASQSPFSDFKSLSQFQENFHRSFTTKPTTTENSVPQNAESLDLNIRPRSETQAPDHLAIPQTNHPNPLRTTYEQVPTQGPQTFQQQPTRFNEDFFKKVPSNSEIFQTGDEDKLNENFQLSSTTENTLVQKDSDQETSVTEEERSLTSTTTRPFRYRRPNLRQRNRLQDVRYKSSRRVENVRFENRVRTSPTTPIDTEEKNQSEEIFKAAASVHTGPVDFNSFTRNNNGRSEESAERVKGEESVLSTPIPTHKPRYRGDFSGRRVRPSTGERAQDAEGDIFTLNGNQRVRKRLRVRPVSTTTTTENIEFVSATTYKPANRIQSLSTLTTNATLTTVKPEQVEGLKSRLKVPSTKAVVKNYKPILLSFKVTSKPSSKPITFSPSPKETKLDDEFPTRSPDYDYMYYDTDHERQLAVVIQARQQEKFGRRFGKSDRS